jgi:hypothetical protein
LTPEEIAHYQTQGYVLHRRPVFPEADFVRLKGIFEEDLEQYGEAGLDVIHFKDPRLMEFLMSDHVLDLVENLIGPDIALWSSHFISKPAKTGKATPWHEDSSYWEGRLDPMSDIVTVWPGTHSGGFSEYEQVDGASNIFGTQVIGVDESKAVYFTLDPNECSLHEGRIIHGAKPNTSEFRRCGYTMRYFPTTTKFFDESPRNAGHRIWLARGKDRAGNRYEN